MSGAAGTSVETLVAALKQRRAALPFEIGAYVALAACERLLEAPAVAGGRDVRIGADGEVRVVGASAANDADAARALLALLAQLLVAAGPGVPPALLALVETRESPSLDAVRDALARALMPLNRAASRRVLARLVRESVRELRPAASDDAPAAVDGLDEDLDALLGAAPPAPEAPPSIGHGPPPSESDVSPSALAAALAALAAEEAEEDAAAPDSPASAAPAASASVPPTSAPATHTASLAEPVPATPASSASVPSPAAPATPASSASVPSPAAPATPASSASVPSPAAPAAPAASPAAPAPPAVAASDSMPPAPSPSVASPASPAHRPLARLSLEGLDEAPRRARRGPRLPVLALLLLTLAGVGLWLVAGPRFGPSDAAGPSGAVPAPAPDPLAAVAASDLGPRGSVVVRATPAGAQVLAFVGRGPAMTEPLPLGVAREFVVVADGQGASRGVVPADAEWDATPDGPRYELALQGGETEVPFEALALGPSRLPADVGAPGDALGRVRVITTPRGAKVYRFVGLAPDARLEGVRTDAALELLVAAEGHVPQRVVVGPSDWREEGGARIASLDVRLVPRAP